MRMILKRIQEFYIIGTILCYGFVVTWYFPKHLELQHIIGLILLTTSLTATTVAKIQLGEAFTWKPKAVKLVTTGIYRYFQHPIYLFGFLQVFGLILYMKLLPFCIFLLLTVPIQIERVQEERKTLRMYFGWDYAAYRRRTWF